MTQQDDAHRKSFLAIARKDPTFLQQAWKSFWLGEFEPAGLTCLEHELVAGSKPVPATRDHWSRLGARGTAPRNTAVRGARDDAQLWLALSAVPYDEIQRPWRESLFELITITQESLDQWRRGRPSPPSDT